MMTVAILTGGRDPHYALGLASALAAEGVQIDLVGGDHMAQTQFESHSCIKFVVIREQGPTDSQVVKAIRVIKYYCRLVYYVAFTRCNILHILWNNQFQWLDRTVLMLFYRALGKAVVLTAHNINAGKRDACDSVFNTISLTVQYRLAQQIFVHTDAMKVELIRDFGIPEHSVTVVPYGWNNIVQNTDLTRAQAKREFGLSKVHKTLLFFGYIAPYKGLEYLITAVSQLVQSDKAYRLIIAGQPKRPLRYCRRIESLLRSLDIADHVIMHSQHIADEHIERYFKAADAVVLPYTFIYQSGIMLIAYRFGVPVLAANVGSFATDVREEKTGLLFRSRDSEDLARVIKRYFSTPHFVEEKSRAEIANHCFRLHSWDEVAKRTVEAYWNVMSRAGRT